MDRSTQHSRLTPQDDEAETRALLEEVKRVHTALIQDMDAMHTTAHKALDHVREAIVSSASTARKLQHSQETLLRLLDLKIARRSD